MARFVKGDVVVIPFPFSALTQAKRRPALVAIDNADMETVSLSNNPEFLSIIERSRARQKAESGISSEEMRRKVGLRR